MKYKILPLVAFLLVFQFMTSQEITPEDGQDELGSWFMFFGNAKLTEHISISPEIQFRTYKFGSNFNQLLIRNGVNWHINNKAAATIGYGYISTDGTFKELLEEVNTTEHRLYEQFTLKNTLWKIKLTHRYRFEQRFIDSSTGDKNTQYRARYLLRLIYPITDKWFVTAYDEIFINLQEPVFSQNRFYTAIGYTFNEHMSTQIGYLKNHFTEKNFNRFQLGIWYNLDLRKKSSEVLTH